jgi:hypothetical protein
VYTKEPVGSNHFTYENAHDVVIGSQTADHVSDAAVEVWFATYDPAIHKVCSHVL